MKRCCRCGIEKPESEFNRKSRMPDGRQRQCRICTRQQDRDYLRSERGAEVRRAGEKAKYERRRLIAPEKLRARYLLRYAVRVGKVKRGPCYNCGSLKTEGHHEDYSKPLDVVWTCREHHADLHRVSPALAITFTVGGLPKG